MIGTILMGAAAITAAVFVMAPSRAALSRIAGYQTVADIGASAYVVSTYASTGSVTGMTMAVVAALGISLVIRAVGKLFGRQRYQYKGSTGLAAGLAAATTQGVRWLRSWFFALWKGGEVTPPPPLEGRWVAV